MSDRENLCYESSQEDAGSGSIRKIKRKHKMELKALREKWKNEIVKTKNKKKKEALEEEFKEAEKFLLLKQNEEINKNNSNYFEIEKSDEKQHNATEFIDKEEDLVNEMNKFLHFYSEEKEQKISKAQMRRMKKQQIENEREVQRMKDMLSTPNYGKIETEKIEEKLKQEKLKVHSVAADGHCMYRALENQMRIAEKMEKKDEQENKNRSKKDVSENFYFAYTKLREMTGTYIHENAKNFLPFLDDEVQANPDLFEKYCDNVRNTAEWGGEVELEALSHVLQRYIIVYAADNEPYKYGEIYKNDLKIPLRLSFHKYLLSLGSHYNSVVPVEY